MRKLNVKIGLATVVSFLSSVSLVSASILPFNLQKSENIDGTNAVSAPLNRGVDHAAKGIKTKSNISVNYKTLKVSKATVAENPNVSNASMDYKRAKVTQEKKGKVYTNTNRTLDYKKMKFKD